MCGRWSQFQWLTSTYLFMWKQWSKRNSHQGIINHGTSQKTISRESRNLSTNLPEMIVEPSAGLFRGFCWVVGSLWRHAMPFHLPHHCPTFSARQTGNIHFCALLEKFASYDLWNSVRMRKYWHFLFYWPFALKNMLRVHFKHVDEWKLFGIRIQDRSGFEPSYGICLVP